MHIDILFKNYFNKFSIAAKCPHTIKHLERQSQIFGTLQKPSEIYDLLKLKPAQYKKLTEKPQYQAFQIGKKGGGEPHIENPNRNLKKVQERPKGYLQAVYYFTKAPTGLRFCTQCQQRKR